VSGKVNDLLERAHAKAFTRNMRNDAQGGEHDGTRGKPFHVLFQEHLERGTRADQPSDDPSRRRWKHEDFADQVKRTPRTVTNWKNGSQTPERADFDRICALLFGDDPLHAEARAEFLAAWQTADSRRGLPGRRTKPAASGAPAQSASPAAAWVPEEPFTLREGLARLYIHRNQGETPGNILAVDVTVEAGRRYLTIEATEDTPMVSTTFAVSAAEIVVVKELNVTPLRGTTLGTADVPHPNVAFASSWHLKVPLAADGIPGGYVLENETLRRCATAEGLPYGIRIDLRCRDIDLKPIDETVLPNVSAKQLAVLRRLLQARDADAETGTICLARTELCSEAGGVKR
jgi:hypothetical protein